MADKKKRMLAGTVGALICIALIVGIAVRFAGQKKPASEAQNGNDSVVSNPVVDIDKSKPEAEVQISAASDNDANIHTSEGADSIGTEQTIQADPTKPEPPDPLTSDEHDASDVPDQDKDVAAPPSYTPEKTTVTTKPSEPAPGSTNDKGQVFVPGFGWVDNGGDNKVIEDESISENGNKVGDMG